MSNLPSARAMAAMEAVIAERTAKAAARRARALFAELTSKYDLKIDMPRDDVQHSLWFHRGVKREGRWRQRPRPVLKIPGRARREAIAAFKQYVYERLRSGDREIMLPALTVAAQAIRAVYVARLTNSGDDLTLAPLRPRYLARKRRLGLDLRIGVARGNLLASMTRGRVFVRKR